MRVISNPNVVVVGIDPGDTTGFVFCDNEGEIIESRAVNPDKLADHCDYIETIIISGDVFCVMEDPIAAGRFVKSPAVALGMFKGAFIALADWLGTDIEFIMQKPCHRSAQIKRANTMLKEFAKNKGRGTPTDHEVDALAHVLAFIEERRGVENEA